MTQAGALIFGGAFFGLMLGFIVGALWTRHWMRKQNVFDRGET